MKKRIKRIALQVLSIAMILAGLAIAYTDEVPTVRSYAGVAIMAAGALIVILIVRRDYEEEDKRHIDRIEHLLDDSSDDSSRG